jgi:hypothetical protein
MGPSGGNRLQGWRDPQGAANPSTRLPTNLAIFRPEPLARMKNENTLNTVIFIVRWVISDRLPVASSCAHRPSAHAAGETDGRASRVVDTGATSVGSPVCWRISLLSLTDRTQALVARPGVINTPRPGLTVAGVRGSVTCSSKILRRRSVRTPLVEYSGRGAWSMPALPSLAGPDQNGWRAGLYRRLTASEDPDTDDARHLTWDSQVGPCGPQVVGIDENYLFTVADTVASRDRPGHHRATAGSSVKACRTTWSGQNPAQKRR